MDENTYTKEWMIMKGNAVGFVTALLTALVVLWQGYEDYRKEHPVSSPVAHTAQKPVMPPEQQAVTPIYWNDGKHWYCQVGEQQYIWVNTQERENVAWTSNIR